MWMWMMAAAYADADPSMSGAYRLTDSPAEVQAFKEEAVSRTLASMNFALRALAGSRVEAAVTACNGYSLTITDTAMTVACDAKPPAHMLFDGTPNAYTSNQGVSYTVTAQRSGDRITATFAGDDASQVTVYEFVDGRLDVHKTVNSPYFGAPLQWTNHYQRVQP